MKALAEYRQEIKREVPRIGIRPFSHNIIGLILSLIAKEYGEAEAYRAVTDFGLDELGWSKKESP